MPEPEWIKIQKDLAALAARVAAFEKAQRRAEEGEPRTLDEAQINYIENGGYEGKLMIELSKRAARRLRWCEAELARLREGLKVREDDMPDGFLNAVLHRHCLITSSSIDAAREIQRHRALVRP